MRKTQLGEFEEIVLLIVATLGDNAYGVSINEAIELQTGRDLSISAIHATLHRLQKKGYVKSYMGGASAERGGRRKRFFIITPLGSRVLHAIRELREQLWNQVPNGLLHSKTT
ncbi:MAG TPA: PadR family transcriptional regulator [Chryseolinea sp.]|nr:PadR family transcriptional regulator [Chryseolinea sp.]